MQNIETEKPPKNDSLTFTLYGVMGVIIIALGAFLWFKTITDIKSLKSAPDFAAKNLVDLAIIPDGMPEAILQKARDKSEVLTVGEYDTAILLAYRRCDKLANDKPRFEFSSELSNACYLAKKLAAAQIESKESKKTN